MFPRNKDYSCFFLDSIFILCLAEVSFVEDTGDVTVSSGKSGDEHSVRCMERACPPVRLLLGGVAV